MKILIALIELTALKSETSMFQEFRTHAYSISVLFPIWVYVYALFITVFCKALLDASGSYHMQRFDFKNSIRTIKLYLMILNLNFRTISKMMC